MSPMQIITASMDRSVLKKLASERFGDMVKAVVDIEQNIMAIGGELHADEEQLLLEQGSKQEHLWGINLYPDTQTPDWLRVGGRAFLWHCSLRMLEARCRVRAQRKGQEMMSVCRLHSAACLSSSI